MKIKQDLLPLRFTLQGTTSHNILHTSPKLLVVLTGRQYTSYYRIQAFCDNIFVEEGKFDKLVDGLASPTTAYFL